MNNNLFLFSYNFLKLIIYRVPGKPWAACRDEIIITLNLSIESDPKNTKGLCFYVDSLLIKSFMKERKREKENIPSLWHKKGLLEFK